MRSAASADMLTPALSGERRLSWASAGDVKGDSPVRRMLSRMPSDQTSASLARYEPPARISAAAYAVVP